METLGFFSRNDRHSILTMGKIFEDSDKYVYFIENSSNEWLSKDGISWTKDPLQAMSFINFGTITNSGVIQVGN